MLINIYIYIFKIINTFKIFNLNELKNINNKKVKSLKFFKFLSIIGNTKFDFESFHVCGNQVTQYIEKYVLCILRCSLFFI